MASLSACGLGGETAKTFNNIVDCVYAELEDPRTLHLFMAMMKLMIDKEVEFVKDLDELFPLDTSLVYSVFSSFALKPHHYQEVVWPFMDASVATSLIAEIVEISKHYTQFALDRKEFAQLNAKEGDEKQSQAEEMAEFMLMLAKLKDFMLNQFDKALMKAMLHPNVRKMLNHTLQRIQARNFKPSQGKSKLSMPAEILICMPLLKLVVNGVIIPILSDPAKYSGLPCFLAKSRKGAPAIDDSMMNTVLSNMSVLGKFLKILMEGGYDDDTGTDPKEVATLRMLTLIGRQVKQSLLKYAKEQADTMVDDTETHTTIDVYTSHYDRTPHSVTVPASDLLAISNLLTNFASKVRQTDDDPVVSCCDKIGPWDEEMINEVSQEGNNRLHNFIIGSRFVLQKGTDPNQPLIICRASDVPMPKRFCATYSSSYVKQYMQDQPDSQCKVLEDLFREIEELKANTWNQLKEELSSQLKAATSKNPPNFIMAHKLQDAIRKVEELASVDSIPGDLLGEMSEKLLARNRHRIYLEQVLKGLHTIKKAQLDHANGLKQARIALKQMVDFSVSPQLPDVLLKAASESNAQLRLERVLQRFQSLKLNRRANLTDCTFSPTATVSLKELMKDDILVYPNAGSEQMQKSISLTFTFASDGGVDVAIEMTKNKKKFLLKQLKISNEQLQSFKRAQEADIANLPEEATEPVLVVKPAKLSKLMTQVQTGM